MANIHVHSKTLIYTQSIVITLQGGEENQ